MTTAEDRVSRMEGAYEQVNHRLNDYVERFAEIAQRLQTLQEEIRDLRGEMNVNIGALREEMNANDTALREEINALRGEMNANDTALREEMNVLRSEMNANNASIRRESRWIGGVIVAGIIITVLSTIITRF